MNIEECLREGLLKKDRPDVSKANNSLETAEHKLGLAKQEFEARIYENAVITAYTAMFHAARALLYRDGYKERSHYALSVYLSELYGDKLEKRYLSELDALRVQRHELMYGVAKRQEVMEVEAEGAVSVAEGLIASVKKLLSKA